MEALLNECKLSGVDVSLPTQMPPTGSLERIIYQLRIERLLLSKKLEVKEEELLNVKRKLVEVTRMLETREEEIIILKMKKKPKKCFPTGGGTTGKAGDVKEVEVSSGRNEIFMLCPNGNGDASSEDLKMESSSSGSNGPIRLNDTRIPSVIVPLMGSTRGITAPFSPMECNGLASQSSASTMADIKNSLGKIGSRNSCEAEIDKKGGTQKVVVVDLEEDDTASECPPYSSGVGTVMSQDTDDPDDTKSHGVKQRNLKPVIPQNRRFWCHECSMEWFTEKGLREHQIAAHEKLVFKCSICNLGFPNFNARNLHAKIHDAEEDKTCKESAAGTVATAVDKSASPPTSESPETKFVRDRSVSQCLYSSQPSTRGAGYYTMRAPSFQDLFQTKKLPEGTVRKPFETKLFQSEMPNFCPPNKKTRGLAPQEISEQKNSEGFKNLEFSVTDTKDKSLNTLTDYIARIFSTRQKKPFQSDNDKTETSSPPKKTRELDQDDESRQLTCEDCGRKFQTKWSLKRHIDIIHPKKKDDMTWSCDICGEDLGSENNLECHKACGCAP